MRRSHFIESGKPERHQRNLKATIGVLAVAAAIGLSYGVSRVVDHFRGSLDVTCEFDGQQEVQARPGWGVDDLAVQIEGVDTVGKKSFCLGAAKAYIIGKNNLNPSWPKLMVDQTYTIPEQLADQR